MKKIVFLRGSLISGTVMRKLFSYLFALLVAAIYIVSTMGYGIHECKHDGTRDVIVLFGETPCEYIHSHVDGKGRLYTHAHHTTGCTACAGDASCACCGEMLDTGENGAAVYHHDGNCCHTTVYSITHDQTLENDVDIAVSYIYLNFAALHPLMFSSSFLQAPELPVKYLSRERLQGAGAGEELYLSNRTLRV